MKYLKNNYGEEHLRKPVSGFYTNKINFDPEPNSSAVGYTILDRIFGAR